MRKECATGPGDALTVHLRNPHRLVDGQTGLGLANEAVCRSSPRLVILTNMPDCPLTLRMKGHGPDSPTAAPGPTGQDGEIADLRAENHTLKDSVTAMRQTLESVVLDRDAAVQRVMADSRGEIENLKAAVAAQREALEALRAEKDRQFQEAVARGTGENRELQKAVASLRESMEAALMDERDRFGQERRNYEDEIRQLRQTVAALRESLAAGGLN